MLVEFGNLVSAVLEFVLGHGFSLRNPVGATFAWLANPVLFFAFIAVRRDARMALKLSLVSTILMLSFLLYGRILDNEAGGYATITAYGAGYWLWVLSSVTILAGSIVLMRRSPGKVVADKMDHKGQYTK